MTEKPEFDSSLAEDAVAEFLNERLYPGHGFTGMPFSSLDSDVTGVIAFERPGSDDTKKFRWDELAAVVARKLGIGVLCIAHADWETDTHDEEAVYIAFDVPGVPEDYLDSYRNMIEPVTPENAPSDEDFRVRDRARKIIHGRKAELSGKIEYHGPSGPEHDKFQDEWTRLHDYEPDAANRSIHDALLALDFEKADELIRLLDSEPEPTVGISP